LTVASPSIRDDGVPGWWSFAENGWRDTVDRLATELDRTEAG